MSKVQPAMFSLQASEKEMGQLVPQLLQMPLFRQGDSGPLNLMESFEEEDDSFLTVTNQDEALANGNIRVAIPVDTAIYTLLRSHCAKGARQAEESINTAMRSNYIPHIAGTFSAMPPIVNFKEHRRNSSISSNGNGSSSQLTPDTIRGLSKSSEKSLKVSSSSISTDEWSTTHSSKISTHSSISMHTSFGSLPGSEASETNLAASDPTAVRSLSPSSRSGTLPPPPPSQQQAAVRLTLANSDAAGRSLTPTPRSDSLIPQSHKTVVRSTSADIAELRRDSGKGDSETSITTPKHKALEKTVSASKARRTSTVLQAPVLPPQTMIPRRSRGDSMDSEISLMDSLRSGSNRWNTSILENNTIATQYGDTPYPIVWWEPGFKVDFRLSSSVGLLSGTVTGIDPCIPEVTLKVFNNSPRQIGFAIRSHRQSSIFSSHVVFPKKGLQILAPHKTWEDNVEFCSNTPSTAEMFVIDLFFCTMDSKPVWNIVRKYAIMKAQKR